MNYLDSSAELSPCGLYRYRLTRVWDPDPAAERVVFLMLNPSTADGSVDDPTIRRCVGFAQSWGYGRLDVVNLFAFRSAYPTELLAAKDPVGPMNDDHIAAVCATRHVICAWGAWHGKAASLQRRSRVAEVVKLLSGHALLSHLGLSKDGQPMHPLYRPADLKPVQFAPEVLT